MPNSPNFPNFSNEQFHETVEDLATRRLIPKSVTLYERKMSSIHKVGNEFTFSDPNESGVRDARDQRSRSTSDHLSTAQQPFEVDVSTREHLNFKEVTTRISMLTPTDFFGWSDPPPMGNERLPDLSDFLDVKGIQDIEIIDGKTTTPFLLFSDEAVRSSSLNYVKDDEQHNRDTSMSEAFVAPYEGVIPGSPSTSTFTMADATNPLESFLQSQAISQNTIRRLGMLSPMPTPTLLPLALPGMTGEKGGLNQETPINRTQNQTNPPRSDSTNTNEAHQATIAIDRLAIPTLNNQININNLNNTAIAVPHTIFSNSNSEQSDWFDQLFSAPGTMRNINEPPLQGLWSDFGPNPIPDHLPLVTSEMAKGFNPVATTTSPSPAVNLPLLNEPHHLNSNPNNSKRRDQRSHGVKPYNSPPLYNRIFNRPTGRLFPLNKEMLMDYIAQGLAVTQLFPYVEGKPEYIRVEDGKHECQRRITCHGTHRLSKSTNNQGHWERMVCLAELRDMSAYQKHIKTGHLRLKHNSLSLIQWLKNESYFKDKSKAPRKLIRNPSLWIHHLEDDEEPSDLWYSHELGLNLGNLDK